MHKLLSSSNSHITSEIEIFDAADAWISYNTEDRSKYAKSLLLQVRFPLLSDCALKHTLNKTSLFKQIKDCRKVIEDILKKKTIFLNKSESYFTNRYCNQPVPMAINRLFDDYSVLYKDDIYTFSGTFSNYDSDDN